MFRSISKILLTIVISLLTVFECAAQSPDPTPISNFQQTQEGYCTSQPMTVDRTYTFRTLPRAPQKAGWFAPKKWWQKWFPFLDNTKKETRFQLDDVRLMAEKLSRPIPVERTGKTDRINAEIDRYLLDEQQRGEAAWSEWLRLNPNASPDAIEKAENEIRFRGLSAVKRKSFDWSKEGLDLGPAENQGWGCSSCWAFASVDAIQIARRLAAMRGKLTITEDQPQPSVRQIVSCMVPTQLVCEGNWHTNAFTYMIEEGLPLGGSDYYDYESPGVCDAEARLKPLTWGYVSNAPTKLSTVAEIKEAVIRFGSVTTMATTDKCMVLYGGGVFNEQYYGDGSHILLIVGWDDTKGKNGAWRVKNSYGADWGENGFGWWEYGANSIGRFSAVVVADPNEKIEPAKFVRPVRE